MTSFTQSQDYIIIIGPGFCQAFSDYQMQQMTSNFIEQFGFNDEEFADQDDVVEWVLILHDLTWCVNVTV